MRVVFMGTPDFAVPCLEVLIEKEYEVAGVITQPDRPKGRGNKITPSPVKEAALRHNLPVYQPERIKTPEFTNILRELKPEVIVVVAFGQLLSREILHIPPKGCINIHASLLPKYRGAAPIHWAVINGEKETGVTSMYMDEGLDTGDMILKKTTPVGFEETTGIIHDRLAGLGAEVLADTMALISEGIAPREPQDDKLATYASLLKKEHELIDWNNNSNQVINLVRGMNPWPGAYTYLNDKILKIWSTKDFLGSYKARSGDIVEILPNMGFVVKTGDNQVLVTELQTQGGRRMSGADFLRGNSLVPGMTLGRD